MSRVIFCAAAWWSGTWHRFIVLDQVKTFAVYYGYRIYFVWGVSSGVSYCRFEELLSPISEIQVINVSEQELMCIERHSEAGETICYRSHTLSVFQQGHSRSDRMFVFDQRAAAALEQMVPIRSRPTSRLCATPSAKIQKKAGAYIREHALHCRLGIRVRATECPIEARKPHRIQRELDEAVKSIIRIPWHVKVFMVTDSEYVQEMLASHFHDARFLPKRFDLRDVGGRYVHRHDRAAMIIFLTELVCLTNCRKIINLGGFLNEASVWWKTIQPPYDRAMR